MPGRQLLAGSPVWLREAAAASWGCAVSPGVASSRPRSYSGLRSRQPPWGFPSAAPGPPPLQLASLPALTPAGRQARRGVCVGARAGPGRARCGLRAPHFAASPVSDGARNNKDKFESSRRRRRRAGGVTSGNNACARGLARAHARTLTHAPRGTRAPLLKGTPASASGSPAAQPGSESPQAPHRISARALPEHLALLPRGKPRARPAQACPCRAAGARARWRPHAARRAGAKAPPAPRSLPPGSRAAGRPRPHAGSLYLCDFRQVTQAPLVHLSWFRDVFYGPRIFAASGPQADFFRCPPRCGWWVMLLPVQRCWAPKPSKSSKTIRFRGFTSSGTCRFHGLPSWAICTSEEQSCKDILGAQVQTPWGRDYYFVPYLYSIQHSGLKA